MGRTGIEAIRDFERQLHILVMVVINQIATKIVDLDELNQCNILILLLVLLKVGDEHTHLRQLV